MKKAYFFLICFVALVAMSFTITNNPPRYKNLKVLPKDIKKEQLDSVMKHFTVALGVKCNFCHVRKDNEWDFPSDNNNHKLVARQMMKMTAKINKKYFDVKEKGLATELEVTCYTCHSGKAHPPKIPAPPPPRVITDTVRRG